MRTLDECKREIFLKSKIKIKRRKKRLAFICTLCTVIILCIGALPLVSMQQKNLSPDCAEDGAVGSDTNKNSGAFSLYTKAEIAFSDSVKTVTDKVSVHKIYAAVTNDRSGVGTAQDVTKGEQDNDKNFSNTTNTVTVTLYTDNGNTAVYEITDSNVIEQLKNF